MVAGTRCSSGPKNMTSSSGCAVTTSTRPCRATGAARLASAQTATVATAVAMSAPHASSTSMGREIEALMR